MEITLCLFLAYEPSYCSLQKEVVESPCVDSTIKKESDPSYPCVDYAQ